MDAIVFVRQPNSTDYSDLGTKEFSVLPRVDEFISTKHEKEERFFQVVAVHHALEKKGFIEIYAVQTEPSWKLKEKRAIGFGPSN